MTESTTYSVVINSELQEGFEPEEVHRAFAALVRLPPEKVAGMLAGTRILKKGLDRTTAENYKARLERIGMVVSLDIHAPSPQVAAKPAPASHPAHRVEKPQASVAPPVPSLESSATEVAPLEADALTCPKCRERQPVGTEQCRGCGVFFHKLRQPAADAAREEIASSAVAPQTVADEGLNGVGVGAGVAAALVGALVWKLVASLFGLELGLIAWAIGGAIGFAVSATGSRGLTAGVVCGFLALAAILGGKYMIFYGFQQDIAHALSAPQSEVHEVYDKEMAAADAFSQVSDDLSLRQFMIDHDYSVRDQAEDVTDDEVDEFNADEKPRLADLAAKQPSFEQWYGEQVQPNLQNLSVLGMMKADFGIIDGLFLLLGVGTAFRLGRGEGSG